MSFTILSHYLQKQQLLNYTYKQTTSSVYNAAIRGKEKKRVMTDLTRTLFWCANLCIKACYIHIDAAKLNLYGEY